MQSLKDQAIIVTGASRGIGAAAALALADSGAKLCLSARSAASCSGVMEEIKNRSGEAFAASCDVADYAAVERLVAETLDRYGRLDAIINNAGIVDPIGAIATSDPEDWARNISVNLLGVYHGTRAVLPRFLEQKQGVIVNISSGAAHNPMEGWSAYCSGKAGVFMLTRATALEAADKGVRVYGFAPGVVDTDMQGLIRASGINEVSKLPRSSLAPAADPATVIAWLCSEAASDLAGQELTIQDEELRRRAGLSG